MMRVTTIMAIQIPWERDLHSAHPVEQLSAHVQEELVRGYDRKQLISELEELFVMAQDAGNAEDQDTLTDVLDCLTHQCAPALAL